MPLLRSSSSRFVPQNALDRYFATPSSPGRGARSRTNACPGVPGTVYRRAVLDEGALHVDQDQGRVPRVGELVQLGENVLAIDPDQRWPRSLTCTIPMAGCYWSADHGLRRGFTERAQRPPS